MANSITLLRSLELSAANLPSLTIITNAKSTVTTGKCG